MWIGRLALLPLVAVLAFPSTSLAADPPGGPTGEAPPGRAMAPVALDPPRLTVDLNRAAVITGMEVGLVGLSLVLKDRLAPATCRWCQPPQLDRWARGQLRWSNGQAASTASDLLQFAIPAGAAVTLMLQAAPSGQRELVEDVAVLVESASTAVLLSQGTKFAAGRLRPYVWASGGQGSSDDKLSFWSGHTAFAFGSAAAATQIARMRGRPGWRWLAAATFGAAALTGYLRVAADRHWLTDVATGAVVGTATGLGVPLLVFQRADGRGPMATLVPAPGGLAVIF